MDEIRKLNLLRSLYKAQNGLTPTNNATVSELKEIKNELKIANDQAAVKEEVRQATSSPYLTDQPNYNAGTVYNSPEETDWKHVRSHEENLKVALVFKNLRRLNIL